MSPAALQHRCAAPFCPELLPRHVRYCAAHEPAAAARRHAVLRASDARRGNSNARGYTYRWHERARAFLRRYPLCGMRPGGRAPEWSRCADEGRVTPATQVDHVVPHRGDVGRFWDESGNWQALCASCGARKSAGGL